MLAISNTGKTINFYMDSEVKDVISNNLRVGVRYDREQRVMTLTPDPNGRKLSQAEQEGKYRMTIPSGIMKEVPLFARLEIQNDQVTDGIYLGQDVIRAPTIRKSPKAYKKKTKTSSKIDDIIKEITRTKNSNLTVESSSGKTLKFKIPDDKLLDLCLEFIQSGYAV